MQRLVELSGNYWFSGTGAVGEGRVAGGDLVWIRSEWVLSAVQRLGWDGNA